jgi:hypothetical protein
LCGPLRDFGCASKRRRCGVGHNSRNNTPTDTSVTATSVASVEGVNNNMHDVRGPEINASVANDGNDAANNSNQQSACSVH